MGRITRNSLEELCEALYVVYKRLDDIGKIRIELGANPESRRATAAVLAISKMADAAIVQWSIIQEMCRNMLETKDV